MPDIQQVDFFNTLQIKLNAVGIESTEMTVFLDERVFKIKPSLDKKGVEIYTNTVGRQYGLKNQDYHPTISRDKDYVLLDDSQYYPVYLPSLVTYEELDIFKECLESFCQYNKIEYKNFSNFRDEFGWLTIPLARLFNKNISGGIPNFFDINSVLLCGTIDEICHKTFGLSTPKLRKLIVNNVDRFIKTKLVLKTKPSSGISLNVNGSEISEEQNTISEEIPHYFTDDFFTLAKILNKSFGVDKVYNILSKKPDLQLVNLYGEYSNDYIDFFKEMGYKYCDKLINKGIRDSYSCFNDLFWMWQRYREGKIPQKLLDKGLEPIKIPRKCKTFEEMHDKISTKYSILKAVDEYKVFNYCKLTNLKLLKSLHKTKYKDMDIIFPKDSQELVDWGKAMKNCIASYSDRVIEGSSAVFSLFKNGKMLYNIEVIGDKMEFKGLNQQMGYTGILTQSDCPDKFIVKQFSSYGNESVSEIEKIKLQNFINVKLFRKTKGR